MTKPVCERCGGTGEHDGMSVGEAIGWANRIGKTTSDGAKAVIIKHLLLWEREHNNGFCTCLAGIRKQFENVPGAVVVNKTGADENGIIDSLLIPEVAGESVTIIVIPDKEQSDE